MQVFVDDCTRWSTLGFSYQKNEALENLRLYNNITSNGKLKRIRSARGTELLNSASKEYFQKMGIIDEKSSAYSQHQNGVAERRIQTLKSRTKILIYTTGAPENMWHFAADHANLITNLIPTAANPNRASPYFMVHGSKPNLNHLKVWGCDAYTLNNT